MDTLCYPLFCMRSIWIFSLPLWFSSQTNFGWLGFSLHSLDGSWHGWWCARGFDDVFLSILTYHREIAIKLIIWCSSLHLLLDWRQGCIDPLVECPGTLGLSGYCIGISIWLLRHGTKRLACTHLFTCVLFTWMHGYGHGLRSFSPTP